MRGYKKEAAMLTGYCGRCGGKCCRGHHILLSAKEYERLALVRAFPGGRIDSPTGCSVRSIDALSGGKCPFLKEAGCELSEKERPLICRMFPLTFTLEKEGITFQLSRLCPYVKEVAKMHAWVAETKKQAASELKDTWSNKELRCFGEYLRKRQEDLLSCD